jgi:prophage tail gpP-like protein
MTDDIPTLTIDGMIYAGWTELRVTRALLRCAGDFDIAVSERWGGQDAPWVIAPYSKVVVSLGNDPVLTGYVDGYAPNFDAKSHGVRITGRSRTEDLIDCKPDIASGQFAGYTLDAIARALGVLFDIEVVIETDAAAEVVADAKMERSETAFTFLERLCRLAGVLLCDDALGRLVLTQAGATRANGAIVQGDNILHATGQVNVHKRFSTYIVKGQHGVGGAKGGGLDLSALSGPGPSHYAGKASGVVQTGQVAHADDLGVPRYRPHVSLAESQMSQAQMQLRANWQRAYAYGQSVKMHVTVQGWRQPDGTLWTLNQLVPLTSSYLGIDADLLAAEIEYLLRPHDGRTTRLLLGPIEGYTPDPGQVKTKKHKGKKGGSAIDLSGLQV